MDAGLAKAREVTEKQVGKLVSKEKLTAEQGAEQVEGTLARITGTTSYDGFGDVDFAIEAVPERMEVKHGVFAELDAATPGHAILASNTSGLSITEIGDATNRPDKVVGFHFFWPASRDAAGRDRRGGGDLPGDAPGRRQLRPGDPQDARALRRVPRLRRQPDPHLDGVGDLALPGRDRRLRRRRSTRTSRSRPGCRWAPFQVADMSGLDTVLKVARDMRDAYGDRFYVHKGMEALVERRRPRRQEREGLL